MAKKTKNPNAMLEKAENFLEKGNYLLAKKEFEKANKTLRQDEISEKIRQCEKEIAQQKAKELIKKGRRSVKKGNTQDALRCFEEAYEITGEAWIRERIGELKTELLGNTSLETAAAAEAAGDYEKAAELYDQAIAVQPDETLLLKKARALVKAEKYADAVIIFKDMALSDQGMIYDYGFALAKLKKYHEALKIWDAMTILDKAFSEQKEKVQTLFAADIYQRFTQNMAEPDPEIQGEALAEIYEQSQYLLKTKTEHDAPITISDMAAYCKYDRIKQLWKAEQYEAIYDLLLPFPSHMNSDMLALYAKVFFRLAEISDKYLTDFVTFFLTALYHPNIFDGLSDDENEREAIRQELIQRSEALIRSHAERENVGDEISVVGSSQRSEPTTESQRPEPTTESQRLVIEPTKALICWNIEKQLIKEIHAIAGNQQDVLVCTVQFAQRFGKSNKILCLIQKNRDSFSDTANYLKTGGYYSPMGNALLLLEMGEYEAAIASLPAALSDKENSEFTAYCKERVYFGYGMYALENGDNRFVKYFEAAAGLFEKFPLYEKELIDKALNAYDMEEIRRYEDALSHIHAAKSTPEIQKALSLVMTRRCIDMYNEQQINFKNLESTIKKALTLDPDNELARGTMERMKVDMELDELNKAIDRLKMNKACHIASKSEFPEVKEEFFGFMEASLEHLLDEADMNDIQRLILLHDFSKWCARVDETHLLLDDIDKEIRRLEG